MHFNQQSTRRVGVKAHHDPHDHVLHSISYTPNPQINAKTKNNTTRQMFTIQNELRMFIGLCKCSASPDELPSRAEVRESTRGNRYLSRSEVDVVLLAAATASAKRA